MTSSATLFKILLGLCFCILLLPSAVQAQEVIPLRPAKAGEKSQPAKKDADSKIVTPTLTVHRPPAGKTSRSAVLVCPGGGYSHLSMEKEGHAVAKWLNTLGITAFVLQYRHGVPHPFPAPFDDATLAMRLIRSHAANYNVDPSKVGILGFSAGGHLASTVGTHFDDGDRSAEDPIGKLSSRPDFMVLIYPVISMQEGITHAGSRKHLIGEKAAPKMVELLSNEMQVSVRTPITFLVHSVDDKAVPLDNSLLFFGALREASVPTQFHIFERGGHGYGMGTPGVNAWTQLCEGWLRDHQVIR